MFTWLRKRLFGCPKQRRYEAGYNYAAGALLFAGGGGDAVEYLEAQADTPFDNNEFDKGMRDALRRYRSLCGFAIQLEPVIDKGGA